MAIKRAIKVGNKSIISFKKTIKVGEITQRIPPKFKNLTSAGITFVNNSDGSVSATGTNTVFLAQNILSHSTIGKLEKNHKYLILNNGDVNTNEIFVSINFYDRDGTYKGRATTRDNPIFIIKDIYNGDYNMNVGGLYIYITKPGTEVNNMIFIPQLFDLTEMFGAGHEPATVAEFKAKFPEVYYPYQRAVLTVYNKVVRPCVRKGEVVQLVDPTIFNKTAAYDGITYTGNINGFVSVSGTATTITVYDLKTKFSDIFPDHIYLITGCPKNGSLQTYNLRYSSDGFGDIGNGVITPGKNINNFRIAITQGTAVENLIFTPQLFDLTAMYGAGNEPKTLADFRKDFSESYYPYSPIQTKNLFDIRKYTGLINGRFGNESASFFIKNLTQNSLTIRLGAYGSSAYLKEPIVLPAGTYTFSCNCNYDAIYDRSGCHLLVSKKAVDKMEMVYISQTNYVQSHHLVLTFTLAEETEVYLSLQGDGGHANYTNLNNVFFNIQLEKGSVATDYVPHDYI